MMSHLILESQGKAFSFYFNPNLNSIITSLVVFVFHQLFPAVAISDLVSLMLTTNTLLLITYIQIHTKEKNARATTKKNYKYCQKLNCPSLFETYLNKANYIISELKTLKSF